MSNLSLMVAASLVTLWVCRSLSTTLDSDTDPGSDTDGTVNDGFIEQLFEEPGNSRQPVPTIPIEGL